MAQHPARAAENVVVKGSSLVRSGALSLLIFPASASANDLGEALSYVSDNIGEQEVSDYRDHIAESDEAAMALLVSRDVEVGRSLYSYDCSNSLVDQAGTLRSSPEDKVALRECRRLMWKRDQLPGYQTLGKVTLTPRELERTIAQAEAETGVPVKILTTIIEFKSGFRPGVISNDGHLGLMQLRPSDLELMGVRHGNLLDAKENILAGARYLRALVIRQGDLYTGLVAYNEPQLRDIDQLLANRETKWFVREVYMLYLAETREFPNAVGAEAMAKVFTWWD